MHWHAVVVFFHGKAGKCFISTEAVLALFLRFWTVAGFFQLTREKHAKPHLLCATVHEKRLSCVSTSRLRK